MSGYDPARKIPWLRRQHIYSDADLAATFECGTCRKTILVEEYDRNLIGLFVYCDECMAALVAEYVARELANDRRDPL